MLIKWGEELMKIKINGEKVNPAIVYVISSSIEGEETEYSNNYLSYEIIFGYEQIGKEFYREYKFNYNGAKEKIRDNVKYGYSICIVSEFEQSLYDLKWPNLKDLYRIDEKLFEKVIKYYGGCLLGSLDWPRPPSTLVRYGIKSIDNVIFDNKFFLLNGLVIDIQEVEGNV